MRLRASLPALLAALAALLAPSRAAASLPRQGETPRALSIEAERLPQLPRALEEISRREERRARCGAFCGEPLELRLDAGLLGREDKRAWGLFGLATPTGPNNNAKARYFDPQFGRFLTQDSYLGQIDSPPSLHRYFYGNANPLRYVDPTGHQSGELKEEYRLLKEEQKAKQERDWCSSQPDACAAKKAAQAEAEAEASERAGARTRGALRTVGGIGLIAIGVAGSPETGGVSLVAAGAGVDQGITGLKEIWTGQDQKSMANQVIEHSFKKAGANEVAAERRANLVEGGGLIVLGGVAGGRQSLDEAAGLAAEPFQSGRVSLVSGGRRATAADAVTASGTVRTVDAASDTALLNPPVVTPLAIAPKRVPNPYGKLGGPAHRAKVDEVVAEIRARGLKVETEVEIPTVGGAKEVRYMDVVAVDPTTGKVVEVHQVGRVLKSDPRVPVARERAALRDVRRSPELRDAKRIFHEY